VFIEEVKKGKMIPRERVQEIENRLVLILRNVSQTRRYRRGMKSIFILIEHLQTLEERTKKEDAKIKPSDHHTLQELWETVKAFLSEFIGRPFDLLVQSVLQFQKAIQQDQDLNRLFAEWKEFLLKTMKDSNYIQQDTYRQHSRELLRRTIEKVCVSLFFLSLSLSLSLFFFLGAHSNEKKQNCHSCNWRLRGMES
jgi:hypothetical protein